MRRGDVAWLIIFTGITAILIFPATRAGFTSLTSAHPYLLGFIKFAVLATMGEMAAVRIINGSWKKPAGLPLKTLIWGLIGILIVLMFQVYGEGVRAVLNNGYIKIGTGWWAPLVSALLTSATMNLSFGIVFMTAHRISDTWIDARARGDHLSTMQVIERIDWPGFIRFVVGKTIPLFWIPAHTITFLLPGEFRVLYAAYLSIALGAILAYARRKKVQTVVVEANPHRL